MRPLKPKQEAFAHAVAAGHSVAAAYVQAGFRPNSGNAYRLGKNEYVRNRIEALRSEIAATSSAAVKRTGITVERILQELARIGFADVRGLFTESGALKHPSEWSDDLAAAIKSIDVVTRTIGRGKDAKVEYVHRIKFWDKNSALEKLAKHLKLYLDAADKENTLAAQLKELMDDILASKPALPITGGKTPTRRLDS